MNSGRISFSVALLALSFPAFPQAETINGKAFRGRIADSTFASPTDV